MASFPVVLLAALAWGGLAVVAVRAWVRVGRPGGDAGARRPVRDAAPSKPVAEL